MPPKGSRKGTPFYVVPRRRLKRMKRMPRRVLEARAGKAMVRAIRAFNEALFLIQRMQAY